MNITLSDFQHKPSPGTDRVSRVSACALTAVLYALFALLVWWSLTATPVAPALNQITAKLLPEIPHNRTVILRPPALARFLKPPVQSVSPPVFTIASSAPTRPAPLPASAAKTSPMTGGTAGSGAMGQAGSGNGNGSGNGEMGCLDAAWMQAVSDRVGHFFYYPSGALAQHITGVVMVHLIVLSDGLLDRLEVGKTSGDASLDSAATGMVRDALPLPPIPARMHADKVDAMLPIYFGPRISDHPTPGNCSG